MAPPSDTPEPPPRPPIRRRQRTLIGLYRPSEVTADKIAADVLKHFGVEPIQPLQEPPTQGR